VAETTEQARREAVDGAIGRDFRGYFLRNARKAGRLSMMKHDESVPDDAVEPEYLVDHHWLVGDPDTVAGKIRDLYELVGGFGTLLVIAHEWPDYSVWDRSMTLLKEEVLPRLADLGVAAAVASA